MNFSNDDWWPLVTSGSGFSVRDDQGSFDAFSICFFFSVYVAFVLSGEWLYAALSFLIFLASASCYREDTILKKGD